MGETHAAASGLSGYMIARCSSSALSLPARPLAILLALGLGTAGHARALTAQDLARHLGVESWETHVVHPLSPLEISIYEVRNGRIAAEPIGTPLQTVGRSQDGHLVILMSDDQGQARITTILDDISSTESASNLSSNVDQPREIALPARIHPGDYILGGLWKPRGPHVAPTITDLRHGLIVRISTS